MYYKLRYISIMSYNFFKAVAIWALRKISHSHPWQSILTFKSVPTV